MTTKNDFYRRNISADIQHIRTFNMEQICLDLSWQHVQGVQAVNAKFVEMCFDNPHSMHHILTNGIDTHAQHLNFTPDVPLVMTVSFWNIPIQMTHEQVNEHIQRFGDIKSCSRSKKNVGGSSVHIGIHAYNHILKKSILRFIQNGGRSVKAKYTGQKRPLQDERDRELQER